MFASSYKIENEKRRLTQLGVLGTAITFILMSLIIHWPLAAYGTEYGPISEFLLWTAPVLFTGLLSGIYYILMNWRMRRSRQSYGVTLYWTATSLLPVATFVSLAEYFALSSVATAFVHSAGLLVSVGIFGLLWLSSRNMIKHSKIIAFAIGFYALAVLAQLWLIIT